MITKWFKSGTPMIWLNAGALSISLVAVIALILLIAIEGLGHFWPKNIYQFQYQEKPDQVITLAGQFEGTEEIPSIQLKDAGYQLADNPPEFIQRYLFKTGNRDISGSDYRQVLESSIISNKTMPNNLVAFERTEWGWLIGRLENIKQKEQVLATHEVAWKLLPELLVETHHLQNQLTDLQKDDIGSINYKLEDLRLERRKLELNNAFTDDKKQAIANQRISLNKEYQILRKKMELLNKKLEQYSFTVSTSDGSLHSYPLQNIVRAYRPNELSVVGKLGVYFDQLSSFIADDPREANTEGGIFPAIFGTVMLVIIMSIFVTPIGVIAAIYLKEYARQGIITRLVRIAVNNLAGVPSIVYGVFGLGFFVYMIGGTIDDIFYPEAAPAPVFGTPGLLWSALTLALLTLPVVIVSTEEGLSRIPRSLREGSLALGSTKFETLWKIIIPMASPAIMTGLILAIARAAGEVAPLMLVGVVKLAPSLPLDGNAPFLHLDRKFMHLGFHIYDVGFQSPNVEAARPLVYSTSFLLITVIISLNLAAISIRDRLREKYRALDN